ncbi:class I SAM-dependent methyltransferase [Streptomyces sp. NPDC048290]|uniref:class I SAM-dependent methyltransferase n=1 Tax=Streptomyces sp. NPDC048290 TaxID=3155811 RepID=UPI003449A101
MTTDSALLRRVVRSGTASDAEIAGLLKDAGLDAVVRVLVDEVLFRCDEPVNTTPVDLALDLTHGSERQRVVFRIVRDRPIEVVDAEGAVIRRELRMDVADLVRRLFGRADHRRAGDFHDIFLPTRPERLADLPDVLAATSQASGTLLSGCTVPAVDLGALSVAYGSDKWASFHWYTAHYQKEFAPYRDEPVRLLEIGIGGFDGQLGGSSLRMWKRYFHRGAVFGLDLFDKSALDQPRLTALTGDQGDAGALAALAEEHGPFDIVIDDGSHENEHVRISFEALFPYVRRGGLYVIEDLQTSYFPRFGGTAGGVAGPGTSVGLLKSLLDDLHYQEQDPKPDGPPTVTQDTVAGVRVYRNIAFIEKGVNGENGIPGWMDDEAWVALGAIPPAAD